LRYLPTCLSKIRAFRAHFPQNVPYDTWVNFE
jgi:hypothetical protein